MEPDNRLARLDEAAETWDRGAWAFGRELQRLRDDGIIVPDSRGGSHAPGRGSYSLTEIAARYDRTQQTVGLLLRVCDKVPDGEEHGASYSAWKEAFTCAKDDKEAFEAMDTLGTLASKRRVRSYFERLEQEREEKAEKARKREEELAYLGMDKQTPEDVVAFEEEQSERDIDRMISEHEQLYGHEMTRDEALWRRLRGYLANLRHDTLQVANALKEIDMEDEWREQMVKEVDGVAGELAMMLAYLAGVDDDALDKWVKGDSDD